MELFIEQLQDTLFKISETLGNVTMLLKETEDSISDNLIEIEDISTRCQILNCGKKANISSTLLNDVEYQLEDLQEAILDFTEKYPPEECEKIKSIKTIINVTGNKAKVVNSLVGSIK